MSSKVANSFLIPTSTLRVLSPRLYQQILAGVVSYEALVGEIIRLIRGAQAFRDLGSVRELAAILRNFPAKQARLIGDYYLLWCKCREREYDTEALESVIDQTSLYKAKGLLLRAALEGYRGDLGLELYFYKEALKASPSISEYIDISRAIAVVQAKEGSHSSAVRELEKLISVTRHADPLVYFDLLNSYAVELGEVGRKDEAENIMRVVLASPFAFAYPEWQQTGEELKAANRSWVAMNASPLLSPNVVMMPIEHRQSETGWSPAPVLDFRKWKARMLKAKEVKPQKHMSDKDVLMRLMDILTDEATTAEQKRQIWEAAEQIISEPTKPDHDQPAS